jgi:transmembrane sensor
MNYKSYTSKDFILDDFFKSWVINPDANTDNFWQNWLKEHPEKVEAAEEARELILQMKFENYQPSDEEYLSDWNRMSKKIDDFENRKMLGAKDKHILRPSGQPKITFGKRLWQNKLGIAASLTILLAMAMGAIYFLKVNVFTTSTSIATTYGEIKKVELPDHSVVTLNANSKLKYITDWTNVANREVWLEGEAFFEIKKKNTGQKFLVHTRDLEVEVLGTKFNVNERRKLTQVVLNEGRVKLNMNKSVSGTAVIMKVGDLIEFSKASLNLRKKLVNPAKYSAWKNKEWILDNLSLQEVALQIEETYGVKVVIENTSIASETVTGVVPTGNLDILLKALAIAFKINITSSNNLIIIQP